MKNNDDFNVIDRFLYKMIICIVMLLLVLLVDRTKLSSIKDMQNSIGSHFNILPVFNWINGKDGSLIPVTLTEEVSVSTKQVYQNAEFISDGRRIILKEMQGVENYKTGVVVSRKKNSDGTYKVIIKGIDDLEYVYDKLSSVDIHLYKVVASGDIIGLPSSNQKLHYFNFYIYDKAQVVSILP